jgi:hypothetical protein
MCIRDREGSVRGGFERFEITPGAILFYLGSRLSLAPIHYEVHGYLPGQYRTAPTLVRNVYRPDEIAVHRPQNLTVLPQGAASADKYRLTPEELFEVGKWHFEKHDYPTAARYLGELLSQWNLKSDPFRDTVRMLLDVHLETGPASEVVRFFEIIIEKYPDLQIPFDKLLKVGDAYDEIGEYERSYLVFRAAVGSPTSACWAASSRPNSSKAPPPTGRSIATANPPTWSWMAEQSLAGFPSCAAATVRSATS